MLEREERLLDAVERFTPAVRLALLSVLTPLPEQRAEAIARLYAMTDAGSMARGAD